MRFGVFVIAVLAFLAGETSAISNAELLDLLSHNGESDVQDFYITNPNEDDISPDYVDDVIDLPGNPEDEADIGSLIDGMGLLNIQEAKDDQLVGGDCFCRRDSCACCISKTVSIKIVFKRIHTTIRACVNVTYVPSDTDFLLKFTLNHKTIAHKIVSLLHPTKICAKMNLIIRTEACLEIYNVNLENKSLCTRLVGDVNFRIKKLYFKWRIACFKIPTLSRDWLNEMPQALPPAEVSTNDDNTLA